MFKTQTLNLHRFLIIILLTVNICSAQEHIYKHFGVDDGLPSSQVYDIYQDKNGYIWFATDKGLSRFNGYEFENFTIQDGLLDNVILNFFPQENGQIWCYGYESQSLFYFDQEFNGFKDYKHNAIFKKHLNLSSIVKSIIIDENESVNFGGHNILGAIEITKEGKAINRFSRNDYVNSDTNLKNVSISIDTEKKLFFLIYGLYEPTKNIIAAEKARGINSRINFETLNTNQFIVLNYDLRIVSKNGNIKVIKPKQSPIGIERVDDNHFFIGYYNGGSEFRNVSGEIIKTFLPKQSVTNFIIDTEGSYWFSTLNRGVFYVKNPDVQVFTNKHVHSLTKDNEGKLYAGFYNGDIVSIHKNKIDTIYKALNVNRAIVGYDTLKNHFYGYSDGAFINYSDSKKVMARYVRKVPENIGNPILKTDTHSYSILKNDSIVRYKVNNKVQDACMYKGEVFIGTSKGLFVHRDRIMKVDTSLDFLNLRIDDIDVNKKGNTAYIATHGAGVVIYGDSIYTISEKDGLTNNIVNEIYIENDTIVWACTNSGLNRISFDLAGKATITTITKNDGLLSNDIDDIEIINDTVWVATKEGLCFFKKDILTEKISSKIISLTLEEVKVNAKRIETPNIKLPYDQNNINFSLQAISHKNAAKINYLYRLKEVDTNWTVTNSRDVRFPSLASGSYTFQAKASVLGNYSNTIVSYKFTISPPFWKTWWFYGLCTLLLSGIIYLFFKIRVLTYNKDIIRELIRLAIKRLKRNEKFLQFRSNGEDFKIPTYEILYIKSQGNYLDIITEKKTYTIRCKIGDFIATTPDALEYLRIHRSYIIRIDQVSSKGKNWVVIKDQKIPVGDTYSNQLEKIQF